MSTTNSRAIYTAVYNSVIYASGDVQKAGKWGMRAETRYLQNQFETPQQLIDVMIEEANK